MYTREPDLMIVEVKVSGSGVLSMTEVTNRVVPGCNSVEVIVIGLGVWRITKVDRNVEPSL
jgi:hypothetical protein